MKTYSNIRLSFTVCRFCNGSSKQLKGCARCLQVFYCSKECQREDWSQRHRDECKAMTSVEKNERGHQPKSEAKEERREIEIYKRKSKTEDRKSSASLDCCSLCGRNGDLKTCKGCDKQNYCSLECQTADWKTHKTSCTREKGGAENNTEHNENSSPICAHCRSKSTSRVCKNCSAVFYCSKSCQKSHWKKHKTSCKARSGKAKIKETLSVEQCTILGLVSPEENNGLDPNDIHAHESNRGIGKSTNVFCCRCKSKRSTLTCPDCNSVTYCSVACLDEDKDDHKEICKDIQEHRLYQKPSHYPSSLTLGMDTSKKEDLWEVNHSPSHSTLVFPQDPLCVQDNADLTLVIERSATSCERAREKIKRQFSSYILITRVREIPIEEISMFDTNICRQPFIFLSYIRRFHGYRGRHNVYLQASSSQRQRV